MVARDIPSNSVAAGVPARVIRSLEEYAEKTAASYGALETKGMNSEEKRSAIMRLRPEWFK